MFLFTLDTQVATSFLTANFLSGLGCCFAVSKQLEIFGMFMFCKLTFLAAGQSLRQL